MPDIGDDIPLPALGEFLVSPRRQIRPIAQLHRPLFPLPFRQVLPYLFGRMAQNRRQERGQRRPQQPERRLRRSPCCAGGGVSIEPVLQQVKIDLAQIHGTELVHPVVDLVELKTLVGVADTVHKPAQPVQDPPVHLPHHLLPRQARPARLEVIEIRQDEPERVAEPPVSVHDLVEDVAAGRHVLLEVHIGHPQPQDLRPQLPHHLLGIDHIAQALRHLPAICIEDETMGQNGVVGPAAVPDDGIPERELEPTPVLVVALQVKIGRPAQLRSRPQHRGMART